MSSIVRTLYPGAWANRELDCPLTKEEKTQMIDAAAEKVSELLDVLRIEHRRDPNTRETPLRVARMYVEELLAGRFCAPPEITEFDSAQASSELIVTGPIDVRSTCAHHLMPIYGTAVIGILPADGRLIGLSKYDRLVQHFAKRFQVQEELVQQIGEYLEEKTAPVGLAVRIKAVHMCKTHRGVLSSHNSYMVSSAYFGELKTNERLKAEFLRECHQLERGES